MKSDREIYEALRDKVFSQGCKGQAESMLCAAEPYFLSDFSYKHSLLRLVMRPLFYMGYEEPTAPMAVINSMRTKDPGCFTDADALYGFMERSIPLVMLIIKELKLCCEFYDVHYDRSQDAVVYRDRTYTDMEGLKSIFLADLGKLDLDDDEIERIFEEEAPSFQHEFDRIQQKGKME